MFPISKRAQATIIAAVVLSVTLLAIPAQAAGPRAFQAQDTPTWSLFSWSFWQDAFSPVLAWFQGRGPPDDRRSGRTGRGVVFDRARFDLDPNGVALTDALTVPDADSSTPRNN